MSERRPRIHIEDLPVRVRVVRAPDGRDLSVALDELRQLGRASAARVPRQQPEEVLACPS